MPCFINILLYFNVAFFIYVNFKRLNKSFNESFTSDRISVSQSFPACYEILFINLIGIRYIWVNCIFLNVHYRLKFVSTIGRLHNSLHKYDYLITYLWLLDYLLVNLVISWLGASAQFAANSWGNFWEISLHRIFGRIRALIRKTIFNGGVQPAQNLNGPYLNFLIDYRNGIQ